MSTRRALIASLTATLLIAGGSVAASTPAEAVVGSKVQHVFQEADDLTSPTALLRVYKMNGKVVLAPVGKKVANVRRVCPSDAQWTLLVERVGSGHMRFLDRGKCFRPRTKGTWRVTPYLFPPDGWW